MKQIETLVEDMYEVVDGNVNEYVDDHLSDFGSKLERVYNDRIKYRDDKGRQAESLRLSSMGTPCIRKLWYKAHSGGDAADLPSAARLKFLFGDVLEEILLQLARDAGHTVEGEQDEVFFNGIKGHRDAVIDGVTVDCKSSSSRAFQKFREGLTPDTDSFGYLVQLASYVYGGKDDETVRDKHRGAFLVIDKQFGHIHLDVHEFHHEDRLKEESDYVKETIANPMVVPKRAFSDEADGKSGNRKLGVACSYCDFKHNCWDNVRTYIYANGPRFLTRVVKEPNVPEVKE